MFFNKILTAIASSISTSIVYAQNIDINTPAVGESNLAIFKDLNSLVNFVINLVFGVGLAIALLFVIIGGIKYVMSKGDEGKATEARNTITNAIIGAVVIIVFKILLNLALNILGGGKITDYLTGNNGNNQSQENNQSQGNNITNQDGATISK